MNNLKAHTPRRPLILCLTGLAVVGVVYVIGYFMAGDRLPRNASVGDVRIGGLTTAQAVDALQSRYAPTATTPIVVRGAGSEQEMSPGRAGLGIDYPATVAGAGAGRDPAPLHIWRVLSGGGPVDPVATVDEASLIAAVDELARRFERPAKDATLAYAGTEIRRTAGETKVEVDRGELRRSITEAYPLRTHVDAAVTESEPDITTAEADQTAAEFARPAVSGPISIDTGRGTVEVTATAIAEATSFVPREGRLAAQVDPAQLYAATKPAIDKLGLSRGTDASFGIENGQVVVVPAQNGLTLSQESFAQAVLPAVPRRDQRVVQAPLSEFKPRLTTEDAERARPKEVIGEFTTQFPHAAYRNTNIGLAASRINGNTVLPGEVFSLDKALGSRDSGYVEGWVVQNGRLREEVGGGVSQSATTLFNAIWFAGLEDLEHQPHTIYFDRYPAGRESTIYSGHIDVKFRNTTDQPVFLEAVRVASTSKARGSITVKVWGTKKWEIESPPPTKSNFYSGRTITDSSPECHAQSADYGFTARYHRLFKQDGQVIKREDRMWEYAATDRIICARK